MIEQGRDLEQTAHHEAGHAVAAYAVGIGFTSVSIVPNEETGLLGCMRMTGAATELRQGGEFVSRNRAFFEGWIVVVLAGDQAERRFNVAYEGQDQGDIEKAVDLVQQFNGYDEELASAHWEWLSLVANREINRPRHWAAVQALATTLMERREISGRQARRIIRTAIERQMEEEWSGQGGDLMDLAAQGVPFVIVDAPRVKKEPEEQVESLSRPSSNEAPWGR